MYVWRVFASNTIPYGITSLTIRYGCGITSNFCISFGITFGIILLVLYFWYITSNINELLLLLHLPFMHKDVCFLCRKKHAHALFSFWCINCQLRIVINIIVFPRFFYNASNWFSQWNYGAFWSGKNLFWNANQFFLQCMGSITIILKIEYLW